MIHAKENFNSKVLCKCYYFKLSLLLILTLCPGKLTLISQGSANLILSKFGKKDGPELQNFGSSDKSQKRTCTALFSH